MQLDKDEKNEFAPIFEKKEFSDTTSGGNANFLPRIRLPIIVEGRYDKSAVMSMFSATVITTDGFSVFNSKEKQALIRRIAKDGIIILTDSDAGGKQIRSFISSILPKEKIFQLYIPRIEGKEKRKTHKGKEGILGVEGVGGDVLRKLLTPFTTDACEEKEEKKEIITPVDMFNFGLSGREDSAKLRDFLAIALGLPEGMNAKALLAALNVISNKEEICSILGKSKSLPKV